MVEDILNPKDGETILSPPMVLKTCAYYVGRWCYTYSVHDDQGDWIAEPYSRDSEYVGSYDMAKALLEGMYDPAEINHEVGQYLLNINTHRLKDLREMDEGYEAATFVSIGGAINAALRDLMG